MASSSQQANQSIPIDDDSIMIEAPDSPPNPSFQNSVPHFSQTKSNSGVARVNGDGAGAKANFGAPGSSWNTKKFNEEHNRAYDTQTDKDWDPAKYGDPLMK